MIKVNSGFSRLRSNYLFAEIARRVAEYKNTHPNHQLVDLGIGDVTLPLPAAVVDAMHHATAQMGRAESFRGYGPYYGYDFLREAIADNDYIARGIPVTAGEVFVSDGCKSDCGSIGDLFSSDTRVAVCDPVYPVYIDANVMDGRSGIYDEASGKWTGIDTLRCGPENGFVPDIPCGDEAYLIYLCFPNNPTGASINKEQLSNWVSYALRTGSVILYDSAYEAFIQEDLPHSIFEIDGAKKCAIEMRSFSKTAGFTGMRCGYTVICKELVVDGVSIREMWMRRQATKFNGVSYITQRGAEAIFSAEGKEQVRANIDFYMRNACRLREGLMTAGYEVFGGVNAPYVWVRTPNGEDSWAYFDYLLNEKGIVATPGSGFGNAGEGFFRMTAFGSEESTLEAVRRLRK
ncbi:MAG: LL-diaminopimelate aminotransferase [Clostridiaceae bacterium]|nr:LL-diaminopimelate aminotransferase [Clostridiaceae bacterium]